VQADLTTVSVMAVKAMAQAITDAVKSAKACHGLESWSSLQNKK
ncbi:MAG: peptidase S58 family protein, partial [Erysipelotrichaceae bacterium]|nr:peptidase S58 family protein [Erysipelotrichaceae bacterium]